MERKIGEIFKYKGEWYQCVEIDSCSECSLRITECGSGTKSDLADEIFGKCSKVRRSDNKHVIFKKLEKVKEPTIIMGKMVQEFKNNNDNHCEYCCFNKDCHPLEIASICDLHNSFFVELKQTKEDMEENHKVEDTPLIGLVGKYVNNLIDYETFEKAVKELYSDKKDSKPTLKEFDLEAAKAGKPVCTRDGRKARIICFDAKDNLPIIALITNARGDESLARYKFNGRFINLNESDCDLMMLPEKKEGWVNIYKSGECYNVGDFSFSKEEIEQYRNQNNYIATVKISWEE